MTDAHGRGGAAPELLYDPEVRTPTHAERVRTLLTGFGTGTLSTIALEPAGYPYGTFVTYAMDGARPVFLISRIAEHTKNLAADPRASLLVHESGKADPLANGRVTLAGRVERLARANAGSARASFLAAHPYAESFVDFDDFDFYALAVEAIRYIGGYGRMSWVDANAYGEATPDPIASAASGIIEHMNDDHAEALTLYCKAFSKARDVERAEMTAIDRYGFEMTAHGPFGRGLVRLAFETPIANAMDARQRLVAMVAAARATLGG
jgi:heme iron utilization protein